MSEVCSPEEVDDENNENCLANLCVVRLDSDDLPKAMELRHLSDDAGNLLEAS